MPEYYLIFPNIFGHFYPVYMIKTKVTFLESRLLFIQSEQFKKYSKSSDWLEKIGPLKKPLLF